MTSNRRAEHKARLAELADKARLAASDQNLPTPVTGPRGPMSTREINIRRIVGRFPRNEVNALADIVTETLLNAFPETRHIHPNTVRYLMKYASWVLDREGYFDPASQMTDARIGAWVEVKYAHVRANSAQSAYSTIRTIRDHGARSPNRQSARPHAKQPHTATEWARFQATAAGLKGLKIASSAWMLLDLGGEAGLRGTEIHKATGTWIHSGPAGVTVTATNRDGVPRDIPVFGDAAKRLAPFAGNPDFLVLPTYIADRRNIITQCQTLIRSRSTGFVGYRATRARNLWLSRMATRPIPFLSLATIADLNPGSHALTDLISYMRHPSPDDAAEQVRNLINGDPT